MLLKTFTRWLILVFLLGSCQTTAESSQIDLPFNSSKWQLQEGSDYPFREQMQPNVIHNDSIRTLSKSQLMWTLGDPDREHENHLFYTISQTLLGKWPLHKKTMVIKMDSIDQVEWIKIHG